jgi:hypothetical protein
MKLTGTLDEASRLATILVSVADPLSQNETTQGPPLILGDYARVVLEGKALEDVVRVPLSWVRDGEIVWVNENGSLAFRPVEIVYQDRENAYIGKGLSPDDAVVTSDITVPVKGMKIRTAGGPADG